MSTLTTSGTADALDTVRVSLHILSATIFVGGQFTVAGLLPTVRTLGEEAPRRIARAFSRLAWPAFGVLVLTGLWNAEAAHPSSKDGVWKAVFMVKIAVVVIVGVAALVHSRAKARPVIAFTGALAGLSSLAAVVLGVALAG